MKRLSLSALLVIAAQAQAVEPIWVDTGYVKDGETTTIEIQLDNRRGEPFEDVTAALDALCKEHAPRAITHIVNMLQVPVPDTIAIIAREEKKGFLWKVEDVFHRAEFEVADGGCGDAIVENPSEPAEDVAVE